MSHVHVVQVKKYKNAVVAYKNKNSEINILINNKLRTINLLILEDYKSGCQVFLKNSIPLN